MNKARTIRTALCVLMLTCCIWAQEGKSAPTQAAAALEITPNVSEVHSGDQMKFTVVAKDAAGQPVNAGSTNWFAVPMDVVSVDQKGTATFFSPGRATVGVVANGKTSYLHINVLPMDVARVEIDRPASPVVVGGVLKLAATPRTAKGDPRHDKPVEWTSPNPSLATVDDAGLVTGIAPGSVEIQAKSGNSVGKVTVKITADPVQKLEITPKAAKARTGDVVHFTAVAHDAKAAS